MKLLPADAHRIKEAAQTLFKSKHFTAYDSDLQAVVCTIAALATFMQQNGLELPIELVELGVYDSIDNL